MSDPDPDRFPEAARIKADERRNSALDRMAGNIAAGFVTSFPGARGETLDDIARRSVELARLIYAEVRKL